MLALSFDWIHALPFAVLGASLLGSGHCVAMCGGLVLSVAQTGRELALYHVGRLLSYAALGAIAGWLGLEILSIPALAALPWISSALIGAGLLFLGVRVWLGRPVSLFKVPNAWLSRLQKLTGHGAFSTGLLSGLLPCGWLHTFVLGAAATRSPLHGAIYLFFFWLGTLPALHFTPLAIRRLIQPFSQKVPRVSGLLLILLGLFSLGLRTYPQPTSEPCHHEEMSP